MVSRMWRFLTSYIRRNSKIRSIFSAGGVHFVALSALQSCVSSKLLWILPCKQYLRDLYVFQST